MLFSTALLALVASTVSAAVLPPDEIEAFPETVPEGVLGDLYLKYKPYLQVVNACVPYPVVDQDGNTSAGLEPEGLPYEDCECSEGQVYARAGWWRNGYFGIIYGWYWPKDSPYPITGLGHKHDLESCVVWLSDNTTSAKIVGAAVGAHAEYDTTRKPDLKGDGLLVKYYSDWPLNHQLAFTKEVGVQQPLIAWESLPEKAKHAVETTDFDVGKFPIKERRFFKNLCLADINDHPDDCNNFGENDGDDS